MALRALQGPAGGSAPVGGTGTPDTIPRWATGTTLGNSGLLDDGTQIYTTTRRVGIGTATPPASIRLDISGGNLRVINTLAGAGQQSGIALTDNATTTLGFGLQTFGGGSRPFIYGNTDLGFGTNLAERMRIDGSGFVGIGTASPAALLDVRSGGTTATGRFAATTATAYTAAAYNTPRVNYVGGGGGGAAGSTTGIGFSQGGNFELYFGGIQEAAGAGAFVFQGFSGSVYAERMRIDSSGNVNVNGTAAGRDVAGTRSLSITGGASLAASLDLYGPTGSSGRNFYIYTGGTPNNGLQFFDGTAGSERMRITSTGNVHAASGTTTMTDGFFYIPAAAGAPTGVPTAIAGRVPMYYDTTNDQFYIRNGANWRKVTLT